jgi:4-hydroxy-tetrahydrodipicolinate synthase
MEISRPLRGVIVAMITPLLDQNHLDHLGLDRLIEHILGGGATGLFILGTTGEAPALSYQLRSDLIERTCRQVAGRVPVLVGITDTAFTESLKLAERAKMAGASAVVASAPFYFPASQGELLDYIHDLSVELPLPLFLYNAPHNTHHTLQPKLVREASALPNVIGLKDSSANMVYFHTVCEQMRDRPDFTLLVGPEELMAEAVLAGGHGGMCGGANFFPKLYVDLYRAAASGDLRSVNKLHQRVMAISSTIYRVGKHDSSYLKGLKCAVSLMGICGDFLAEPFRPFMPQEREQVERHMASLGISARLPTMPGAEISAIPARPVRASGSSSLAERSGPSFKAK